MSTVRAADYPCEGCGGILHFKTPEERAQHAALMHPSQVVKRPYGVGPFGEGPPTGFPITVEALEELRVKGTPKEVKHVATKPTSADPDNCRLCARFAPDRCKRHGGITRSTSHMGRKERREIQKKAGGSAAACSACHRSDGTHTAMCRSLAAARPKVKPETKRAFKGKDMLAAAIKQLEAEARATQVLLARAHAFAKELAG